MKKQVGTSIGVYAFNPASKQITITGMDNMELEQLLLITNVTSGNTMIYQFNDLELGASISNNVITLNYDTSLMQSSDRLQIWVEVQDVMELLTGLTNQISLLVDLAKSLSNVDAYNRQIVSVASVPTTTVTGSVAVNSGSIALLAGVNEIGKVTQTYADSQMLGQSVSNQAVSKFTF